MKIVGLVGAGHMGSGLGWALREGGHDVVTSLAGRSDRTARLARDAGLRLLDSPVDVFTEADMILVVTPPGAAVGTATEIAAASGVADRTGRDRLLVVDMNAISPTTAGAAAEVITAAGFDFVDGSISGPPPTVRPGARLYLSGPRAGEVADLRWTHARPVVVGDRIGAASAVKMSTASVYKGLMGLMAQAVRSASAHGVLEPVMDDLGEGFGTPYEIALASTKAHRYVAEMREIARSQAAAGLTPTLFEAFADVWSDIAGRPLADGDPETVSREITALQVAEGLKPFIDKIAWIRIEDGAILSTRSRGKDVYYLPGGKREPGESDTDTLVREIREELGVTIVAGTAAHDGTFHGQAHGHPGGTVVRMTCYTAEYQGELSPDSEIEELIWLTYADRHRVSPVDQIIFDELHRTERLRPGPR